MIVPQHKILRDLLAYWRRKAGARPMPARADIDPVELKPLLPYVGLVDVQRTPLRFRYRLVGTEITRGYGLELTGRYLDDADLDGHTRQIIEEYSSVAATGEPACSFREYSRLDGRHVRYERMLLPLSNDGKSVDMLFGGCVFDLALG